MQLVGANPAPQVTGLEELPGKSNYFIGNDPKKWRTNIPTYTKVKYQDVYSGVDLVYYGNQRQLEYDFVVAPGADPKAIWLAFEGADKLEIDDNGDLVLHTEGGEIRLHKPRIYQEINGVQHPISGGYVLLSPQSSSLITFHVVVYDTSRPLVIDPVLVYSTYLGGDGGDGGLGIAVDAAGNVHVTGYTASADFPTASPLQPAFGGGSADAFVAKVELAVETPVGANVTVQPIDSTTGTTPVTLTFSNITQAGTSSLTTSSSGPPPPSGFKLGSPATYYNLTTTAVFSGPVTVCINYSGISFGNELKLKLFHFENGNWVELTTTSQDLEKNIICASVTSLSLFGIFEEVLVVDIDIKPGSYPNSINLGSGGTVPVAIFSTATFDALTVDSTTVTLASAPVKLKGQGTPMASFEDVDGDGFLDLVVHVTTEALQLSETDTEAILEGQTFDGTLIMGVDTVRVVP